MEGELCGRRREETELFPPLQLQVLTAESFYLAVKSQTNVCQTKNTVNYGERGLYIKTKKVDKVEGEAYVNVRKGKIIPGYEISLTLAWEGEAKDADGKSLLKADGLVEIPYIADENADEDPDLRVSVKDEGPIGKRLKEAMLAKGKPLILVKVRVYVESMAKGGPAKEDLEIKKVAPKAQPADSPAAATTAKPKEPVVEKKKKAKKKGFKTITLTEKFSCRAGYSV
ncbi:uncharacterized protein LOC132162207 [Corylus avellana]|uniref:uncharacterized protein LOC132162207 n=1 Tax=Corylus avellana TaxID=13451 RepID=UPI00286B0374|nr:uncharacterized protein LOC132162207 [Corylus avellana]